MGEDQTDDLQEQEELEELPEQEDLQGLEDALAEEYAAEDGGTGLSYYNESGYDYDASNPLTDIDYQSGADESSQFTSNGTGSEAYDPVSRDNDESNAENADGSSIAGEFSRWSQPSQRLNNAEDDNFDGNEGFDDDNEADDEDEDDEDEDDDDEQAVGVTQSQGGNEDDYDGAIKWRPGQPITVKLLSQTWPECRKIRKVRNLVEDANEQVTQILSTLTKGPNLVFRANKWVNKFFDPSADMISSLIKLATSAPTMWLGTFFSALESIGDQQHTQTFTIATWPATFEGLLATGLKPIMDKIHKVAVPIINKKSKKNNQQQTKKKSMVDKIHDARTAKYS